MTRCLIAAVLMFGLLNLLPGTITPPITSVAAKCVGADPCKACSNCRSCSYCKSGKMCGACKPKKVVAINICR